MSGQHSGGSQPGSADEYDELQLGEDGDNYFGGGTGSFGHDDDEEEDAYLHDR